MRPNIGRAGAGGAGDRNPGNGFLGLGDVQSKRRDCPCHG